MGILSARRRSKDAAREAARPNRDAAREASRQAEIWRDRLISRAEIKTFPAPIDPDELLDDSPDSPIPDVSTPFADRHGRPLFLNGLWEPAHLFLVSSGPSIRSLDLSLLRQRGICTMGLNNSPAIFRPNFWTFIDPPHKFHGAIWRDPAILKFCPSPFMRRKPLRDKIDGQFHWMGSETDHVFPHRMPSVVAYHRGACFDPAAWLAEPRINWGNNRKHARANKRGPILNVLLAAIGIAHRLGFRTINLLGCDFRMDPAQPYAFAQEKSAGGVEANNNNFRLLNEMFCELRPHFDAAGLKVQNCNPRSGLTAFDYCRFDVAVREATAKIPQDPLDTEGWYG